MIPRDKQEELLVSSARAVMAAFRHPLELRRLSYQAQASLRLLEEALRAYSQD